MYPENLRYSRDHEWARADGDEIVIGITHYAQEELGDVVFVELPAVDTVIVSDQEIGEVESTKATSSIYSPVSGKIVEVNTELEDHPEYINKDPYGQGWLAVVELSNPAEVNSLMTASQYEEFLSSQS